jgi:amino acid adenylation domain-containing protein
MSSEKSRLVVYGKESDEQRRYWVGTLSRELENSNLVLDYDRATPYQLEKEVIEIELPDDASRRLVELTKGSPFLIYTALLSALSVVLQKYTGNRLIVVGSPPRKKNDIVPAANALAIVNEVDERLTVKEWLLKVRANLLAAYERQAYPYERLVEHLGLAGLENRCPLFDVALILDGLHGPLLDVKNDITINFNQDADRIAGSIAFNRRLFAKESIERLKHHLIQLARQMFAETSAAISDLHLLTDAERQQVLVEWNDTRTDWRDHSCIHELFEAQVRRTPGHVAIACEGERLTYDELNQRANQLAHYLKKLDVRAEVKVGLCVERSSEMVIGLLGIIKAGGAYVPLDPSYPKDRLAFMLEDANVKVLLTQRRLTDDLPECDAQIVCLDADWSLIAAESEQNLESDVSEDNLLSLFYTSGSTGTPKGVMITHGGIRNTLMWRQAVCSFTAADNMLQNFSFAFDPSLWQILTPIISGARLTLAKPGLQDSAYMVRVINEEKITLVDFVPATLDQFLEAPGAEQCTSLRLVFCGGEVLHSRLARRFAERLPAQLRNQYGPTEAAIDSTSWLCEPDGGYRTMPIGRPIANKQIYLLDRNLEPVPVGAAGEIYIGGAGVARGYLNVADLTAERFIPDPFSAELGSRLYRTGDRARYHADGSLEFLGRLDHQVKIRGNRIEPEEIEAVLKSHESVRQAIVMAREDIPGEKQLVAYVVFSQEAPATVGDLRAFLDSRVPVYMVPAVFVVLDSMPMTPQGKEDRRALPAPQPGRRDSQASFAAPQSETEETLAGIWAEVLHLQEVGVDDSFFELGGHSLLATQVISRARDAFDVDLTVRDLFEARTVAQMAEVIERLKAQQPNNDFQPIQALPRGGKHLDELLNRLDALSKK